jgi:FtsH-binding integral membrane protein
MGLLIRLDLMPPVRIPSPCHGPMPFALNFVHPVLMWALLGLMLYSGYLGYKTSLIRKVSAEERKAMIPLHYGQRHAQLGAVILGLTLLGAAGGLAATDLKNGKLILGPHLFVGVAVAVLVIASASLGTSLQKGKDWARGLHVAINGGVLLLFGWQAFTGIAIVQKLLSSAAAPASLGT